MPSTPFRNLLYRAALPAAPTPKGQMTHQASGHPIHLGEYEKILQRHHVLGSSLLLSDGQTSGSLHTSVKAPHHPADERTMFRVASITKMATALVVLSFSAEGAFRLDDPVAAFLPGGGQEHALKDVTIRQLLSHTSGLQDVPAYEDALRRGETFHHVLRTDGVRAADHAMRYCNFGFGLLGCMLEYIAHTDLETIFQQRLFQPLSMSATLNAASLDERCIMPISRIVPYRKGNDVTITRLGRQPLSAPDPERHFGHTAGAMYTNCESLSTLLQLIGQDGSFRGKEIIPPALIRAMKTQHSFTGPASSPFRRYGLGLVILERNDISPRRLYGHQGFAYGCVDGAFIEEDTSRQIVFLNGGCSEAREGRLGLCNKDLLIWALQKELPTWIS